jgi:Flp pilus assembly protein protease CpaA
MFTFFLWKREQMGAGDVKLAVLAGLIVGAKTGLLFSAILLLLSLLLLALLHLADGKRGWLGKRFTHFAQTGRVPYGCVLALASALCMWWP